MSEIVSKTLVANKSFAEMIRKQRPVFEFREIRPRRKSEPEGSWQLVESAYNFGRIHGAKDVLHRLRIDIAESKAKVCKIQGYIEETDGLTFSDFEDLIEYEFKRLTEE